VGVLYEEGREGLMGVEEGFNNDVVACREAGEGRGIKGNVLGWRGRKPSLLALG